MTLGEAVFSIFCLSLAILPIWLMFRRDDPLTFYMFLAYPMSLVSSVMIFFFIKSIANTMDARHPADIAVGCSMIFLFVVWIGACGFAVYRKVADGT
jgi:hypothetical protein